LNLKDKLPAGGRVTLDIDVQREQRVIIIGPLRLSLTQLQDVRQALPNAVSTLSANLSSTAGVIPAAML
jgi:hypothetical protein